MAVGYKYYVCLYGEDTKEKPSGLFRSRSDSPLYLEALRADGEWHYSERLALDFSGHGDILDNVEEVDEATAKKAFKHLGGNEW